MTRQYKERAQEEYAVGDVSMSTKQWADHFKANRKTFANWVRAEGIELAVKKVISGEHKIRPKKARKPRKDLGKTKKKNPDMTALIFDKDLELIRRIAAYRKLGTKDEEILDRERRASYGNGR